MAAAPLTRTRKKAVQPMFGMSNPTHWRHAPRHGRHRVARVRVPRAGWMLSLAQKDHR